MMDFKERIIIEEKGILEFSFTQIYTVKGIIFFVGVIDANHKVFTFSMIENPSNNQWKIITAPGLPGWIIKVEEKLSEAINKNID